MKLQLKRFDRYGETQFGELYIDSTFVCDTIERFTKLVPNATYQLTPYDSPGNKQLVLWLKGHNIDDRMIEIHSGNTVKDSQGCIIVGDRINNTTVIKSRDTLKYILTTLNDSTDIQHTIEIL